MGAPAAQPNKALSPYLLAGAVYFFLVSAAHLASVKIPLLYVYFNVPSTPYQDTIISSLAFGWGFFFLTVRANVRGGDLRTVRYLIWAGTGAVFGLAWVNVFTDFSYYVGQPNARYHWLEAAVLGLYLAGLARLARSK